MTKIYYNMITIHNHVTNPLYYLIIKLYKVILYLYFTHKHPHTHHYSHKWHYKKKKKVMHTINIRHTYTHNKNFIIKSDTYNSQTLTFTLESEILIIRAHKI